MSLAISTDPVPLTMNDGGAVLVTGTRVTLDTVVAAWKDGATAEEILQQFPSMNLADVYAVIGYYLKNKDLVEGYLAKRQEKVCSVRAENEARFDSAGVRERLIARQQGKREP